MKYGIIIVKNNYEVKNDLVYRPLVRAYKKIGANTLIKEDNALILGIIKEDGSFHELFTKREINTSTYDEISMLDIFYLISNISLDKANDIRKVINQLVFGEPNDLVLSTMEELAFDRAIEFHAYNCGLTDYNVYSEPFNAYNDFSFKLSNKEKVKKMV